jgi:hypothetical protein
MDISDFVKALAPVAARLPRSATTRGVEGRCKDKKSCSFAAGFDKCPRACFCRDVQYQRQALHPARGVLVWSRKSVKIFAQVQSSACGPCTLVQFL